VDAEAVYRAAAIARLRDDRNFRLEMASGTWLWRVAQKLRDYGPGEDIVGEGFTWGMSIVDPALNEIFGRDRWRKETREYHGNARVWVVALDADVTVGEELGGHNPPH
jgi:hypothetical protein